MSWSGRMSGSQPRAPSSPTRMPGAAVASRWRTGQLRLARRRRARDKDPAMPRVPGSCGRRRDEKAARLLHLALRRLAGARMVAVPPLFIEKVTPSCVKRWLVSENRFGSCSDLPSICRIRRLGLRIERHLEAARRRCIRSDSRSAPAPRWRRCKVSATGRIFSIVRIVVTPPCGSPGTAPCGRAP